MSTSDHVSPATDGAPQPIPSTGATRRGLVLGAAAGAAATGALGSGAVVAPAQAAGLPLVRPRQANTIYLDFGVNAFPNKLKSNYRYYRQWMAAADDLQASYFRGLYAPGLPRTQEVVANARRLGLRWVMQVARDIDTPDAEIRATIRHIARNAADRCLAIEGVNEPNYVRGVGPAPAGWPRPTARIQRTIWEAVKSYPQLRHTLVLGPTLQDVSATPGDYRALRDLGILRHMDLAPIHRYPNGRYPDWLMDERLAVVRAGFQGKPVWINEFGYHNALGNTSGHKPVPEWVAARYAPMAVLEAADRYVRLCWFELLDQYDPGTKTDREANFGLVGVRTTTDEQWRRKPMAASLRSLLSSLRDPGPFFVPERVPFKVTSPTGDVRATLTQKRDGSLTAHLRRATDCWDAIRQQPVPVRTVTATLQTSTGTRRVDVGPTVVSVRL